MFNRNGEQKVKVSICCITYNHEDYIELALQSFLSQETTFRFEILINDDASTDKTAEIIRKYKKKFPDIIHCIYQKQNQYSKGKSVSKILFEIAKGDYIAICEGDDFWITNTKLQIQYDFMENNPEYSLCTHSGYNIHENGQLKSRMFRPFPETKTVTTEEVISRWLFPTASLFYRKNARPIFEIPFAEGAPCGDYPLVIFLSLVGKVMYFDNPMCVYRNFSKSSLSRISRGNIKYRLDFGKNIIMMLMNLDDYTNQKFTESIMARIFMYQSINSLNPDKALIKFFRSKYYRNLPKQEKIKHVLLRFCPQLYRKIIWLKTQVDIFSFHRERYSAMDFEVFIRYCKKID